MKFSNASIRGPRLPANDCQQSTTAISPRRTRPVFVRNKTEGVGLDTLIGALCPFKNSDTRVCRRYGPTRVERWPPCPEDDKPTDDWNDCASRPWGNSYMPSYTCCSQPPLFYGHGRSAFNSRWPPSNCYGQYNYDRCYPYQNYPRHMPSRGRLDGHSSSGDWLGRRGGRYDLYGSDSYEYIKVHYCRICKRFRSRRYHRENPLRPGSRPIAGLCGRCYYRVPRYTSHRPFPYRASGRIVGERDYEEAVVRERHQPRSYRRRHGTSSSQRISIHRRSSAGPSRSPARYRTRHGSSESVTRVRVSREHSGPPIGKTTR